MIAISFQRPHLVHAKETIFRYFSLLQLSNLKNVAGHGKTTGEYLTAKLFNCLLQEVELLVNKKLINTTSGTVRIKFTEAQAIAFYRSLLSMPVPFDQYYLSIIRNHWIEMLDKELFEI